MRQELDEARRAEFERLYNAYRLQVHGYCARRTSQRSPIASRCTHRSILRRLDPHGGITIVARLIESDRHEAGATHGHSRHCLAARSP